jgi:hypothetical protein
MANKARIKILKKGEKTAVYHVLPPPQKFVEQNMLSNIVGNAYSFPFTPAQLSETAITKTQFVPAYLLEYSVHQNFSTTVGTIHRIHINKERLFLNAQDGSLISSRLARMVTPQAMVDNYYSLEENDVSSDSFKIDYSTAKRLGTRHIRKFHTTIVRYTGANNVTYSKKCVPNVSNILVKSLTQVYIPVLTVSFQIMRRQHKITLCGNPQAIDILGGTVDNCEICGNTLPEKRLLCNSCGKIVHKPQIFLGHSYFCELCNKTICRECTYWTRKYRLFKKKICKNCAEKLQQEGIEIRKLRSPVFFSYSTQN